MLDLHEAFAANWQRLGFGKRGDVLLALSGGLDSMVLAELLLKSGIPFAAAHCNFGLRGAESDGDEQFVTEWAAARNIVLYVKHFGLDNGAGIQVRARELRYAWFEELRSAGHYAAILTAHHADDVAETMLINLARGTGLAGLQGVPERNGHVVRPLLFANRITLRDYAESKKLRWREDSSNASDKYLRNAIRHRVLPVLEELLPGAAGRIAASGRRVAGILPVYRKTLDKIMKPLIQQRGRDQYVPLRLLRKQSGLDNLIFELFQPYGFGADQVAAIRALMDAPSGKYLQSATHRILRDREFMILTAAEPVDADLVIVESADSSVRTHSGELDFRWRELPTEISADPDIALLDARDISFPLTLRSRREGDYFYPLGMGGKKKKLKRFLIDVKMPVSRKERLLVLEQEGKILWVVGSRIDERFKIRPDTTRVLEVRFRRAE